jgi:hypothetical protein
MTRSRGGLAPYYWWALGGFGVLAAAGAYYSSAYWAVHSLENAAERNDLAAISEKVDLEAVKDQLKKNAGPGKSQDFLEIVGATMATLVTGPIIDGAINPENVARLIRDLLNPPPAPKGQPPVIRPAAHMHYESLDRFVVDLVQTDKDGKHKTTGIIFTRQGLFGWRLTSLEVGAKT